MIAKAEALYAIGNFEIALVYFERAGKLRQCQEIKEGTKKCREAILLTLGKQSDQFDEKTVQKVISETSNGTKKKKTARSKTKTTSMADVVQEVSKVTRKNKKILGEKLRGGFHDNF